MNAFSRNRAESGSTPNAFSRLNSEPRSRMGESEGSRGISSSPNRQFERGANGSNIEQRTTNDFTQQARQLEKERSQEESSAKREAQRELQQETKNARAEQVEMERQQRAAQRGATQQERSARVAEVSNKRELAREEKQAREEALREVKKEQEQERLTARNGQQLNRGLADYSNGQLNSNGIAGNTGRAAVGPKAGESLSNPETASGSTSGAHTSAGLNRDKPETGRIVNAPNAQINQSSSVPQVTDTIVNRPVPNAVPQVTGTVVNAPPRSASSTTQAPLNKAPSTSSNPSVTNPTTVVSTNPASLSSGSATSVNTSTSSPSKSVSVRQLVQTGQQGQGPSILSSTPAQKQAALSSSKASAASPSSTLYLVGKSDYRESSSDC